MTSTNLWDVDLDRMTEAERERWLAEMLEVQAESRRWCEEQYEHPTESRVAGCFHCDHEEWLPIPGPEKLCPNCRKDVLLRKMAPTRNADGNLATEYLPWWS